MKAWIRGVAAALAFGFAIGTQAHGVSGEMAEAAQAFLASLKKEQREQATFELKDEERLNWHFIPRERKGLSIKDMTGAQRALAHGLLNSGMSHRGYFKATAIMSLEGILRELEQGRGPNRDPEQYFVSIFGEPSDHGVWAWRFEGHHLSLNITVDGHDVTVAPSFMGSNPGEVREGPRKGLRVLAAEEDLGRKLVKSLNAEQAKKAIVTDKAPSDIITGADRKARVLEPKGIAASELTEDQRELLKDLVTEYVFRARHEVAASDVQAMHEAGPEKIFFAWAGSTEPGQGHYYRVQGPEFLLEYDNTQNNANHVHAVWRDLKDDFGGEDLLRKHYDEAHKK